MRRAAKTDDNHMELIRAFRKAGFSVADTSKLGKGFPDIVIARNLHTACVEIKDGKKPPSARKLTGDERKFRDNWMGAYFVVKSIYDVVTVTRNWPDHVFIGFALEIED